MTGKLKALTFILLLCSVSVLAQGVSGGDIFKQDLVSSLQGTGHVLSNPLRWESRDFLIAGATIGGALILYNNDNQLDRFFSPDNQRYNALAETGKFLGDPLTVVGLTASLYTIGLVFDSKWARHTAKIFTSALLAGGVLQTTAKTVVGRARPYMNLGRKHYNPFPPNDNYNSFVSGHTLVAFSTAMILAEQTESPFAKTAFYSLGLLGSWARMYQRNHFASDVFLGMVLSYAVVTASLKWHGDKNKLPSGEESISLGFSGSALNISYVF